MSGLESKIEVVEETKELTIKTENILNISNFNTICRICLVSDPLLPLFTSPDEKRSSVLEFLKSCASIEVSPEDGLPENICKMCASEVLHFQGFIRKCQDTDQMLRLARAISLEGNDLLEIVGEPTASDSEKPITVEPIKTQAKRKRKVRHPKYPCEICGKEFDKFTLQNHRRTHTKEKPFVCQICGRGFSIVRNLKRHIMLHTGERPHVCQICDKGIWFNAS